MVLPLWLAGAQRIWLEGKGQCSVFNPNQYQDLQAKWCSQRALG